MPTNNNDVAIRLLSQLYQYMYDQRDYDGEAGFELPDGDEVYQFLVGAGVNVSELDAAVDADAALPDEGEWLDEDDYARYAPEVNEAAFPESYLAALEWLDDAVSKVKKDEDSDE